MYWFPFNSFRFLKREKASKILGMLFSSPLLEGKHLEPCDDTICVLFALTSRTPLICQSLSIIISCRKHTLAYHHEVNISFQFCMWYWWQPPLLMPHLPGNSSDGVRRRVVFRWTNHETDISLWRGCAVRQHVARGVRPCQGTVRLFWH